MAGASHHRAVLAVLVAWLALTLWRVSTRTPSDLPDNDLATRAPTRAREGRATIAINRASESELAELPGIGPKLAQRIVRERGRLRGFCAIEELDAVRGVGPALLRRIEDRLDFSSQINGPARPCDHGHAVREAAVEEQRAVRGLHGQAEVAAGEPVDAQASAAADRPTNR